jgi:hypothetical protein
MAFFGQNGGSALLYSHFEIKAIPKMQLTCESFV